MQYVQLHTGFGEEILTARRTVVGIVTLTVADDTEESGHHLDETRSGGIPEPSERIGRYRQPTEEGETVLLDDHLLCVGSDERRREVRGSAVQDVWHCMSVSELEQCYIKCTKERERREREREIYRR
jgi:hypothetical protein